MPSTASTPTTATTHQAKRPYAGSHSQTHAHHQSTITSYFSPASPTTLSQSLPSTSTLQNSSSINQSGPVLPVLPELVQSNLLSVGMRVRKSVPEGYKTGLPRKYPLGFPYDTAVTTPASAAAAVAMTGSGDSTNRELAPFCGIMKVGGLAVQSWSNNYIPERDDIHVGEVSLLREDDVPFLSSQGSTISTVSVESRMGYKRPFEDDDEEEEEPEVVVSDIWRDPDEDDVQLSLKTRPVDVAPRFVLGLGRRAVAVPRSRRKGYDGRAEMFKHALLEGQENNNGGVLDVDFGDAEFMDWSSCLA